MNTIENLASKANRFDTMYNMIDDHGRYRSQLLISKELKSAIAGMTEDEKIELASMIKRDSVLKYFGLDQLEVVAVVEAPKAKSTLSKIMSMAWSMFRTGIFKTFGAALSASWKRFKLTQKLRAGIAYFSFTKADGTIREAIGSNREGNHSYEYTGTTKKENPLQVKYFDLEKRAFRSLNITRLIEVAA